MQHFLSAFRVALRQKGLVGLVILGLMGGSSLILQLPPSVYAASNCSSHIEATHHARVQAHEQANHIASINEIFPGQKPCISMSALTAGVNINQVAVAAIINRVFGPYASGALHVAVCESGLNPNAYNATPIGGSYTEGVFQILYPRTWMTTPEAASSPYDAAANILAAYSIFARDGYSWQEWTCRP